MMMDAKTDLPTPLLRLYNSDGSLAGTREFTNTQHSAPIPVPDRSLSSSLGDSVTGNLLTSSEPSNAIQSFEISPMPTPTHSILEASTASTMTTCPEPTSIPTPLAPIRASPLEEHMNVQTPFQCQTNISQTPTKELTLQPVKLFTPTEDDGEVQQTEVDLSEVLVQPSPGGDPTELKTSLARAISKAIGRTKMLEEFDEARSSLKAQKSQKQKLNSDKVEKHEQLLIQLQTYTLARKQELKELVRAFEAQFYEKHKRIPRSSDDEDFAKKLKDLNYVKWLLTQWNIQI